jgi:hypothetical protein
MYAIDQRPSAVSHGANEYGSWHFTITETGRIVSDLDRRHLSNGHSLDRRE